MKRHFGIALSILSAAAMLSACGDSDTTQQNIMTIESVIMGTSDSDETMPPSSSANTEADELPFYGTWAIKGCQPAETFALSTDEMTGFLDYTITYQVDAVFQNEQKIDVAELKYEEEPYTEDLLVQNYHANLGEWWNGIKAVSCVSIESSEKFFGDQFFIVDDNTLWIYYEGVFFIAKKE